MVGLTVSLMVATKVGLRVRLLVVWWVDESANPKAGPLAPMWVDWWVAAMVLKLVVHLVRLTVDWWVVVRVRSWVARLVDLTAFLRADLRAGLSVALLTGELADKWAKRTVEKMAATTELL